MSSRPAATPQPAPATEDGPQVPISRGQIEQALWVAFCGALGGFLFWLLGKWSGTDTFAYWKWYGQIPALAFLGAIAALFGVFLLTASSLNAIKTYVFAIVCGLVWQPIINTAIKSYGNVGVTRQVAQVSNQTQQLQNAEDHGSPEEVTSAVKSTAPAVTQALKRFPDVQDAAKTKAIIESSDKALVAFEAAASKAPDASIQAIKEVGIAASESNHVDVGIHAINSLHEIGMAGAKSKRPEVAEASIASLRLLAVSGKDPALRNAAVTAQKEIEAETKK